MSTLGRARVLAAALEKGGRCFHAIRASVTQKDSFRFYTPMHDAALVRTCCTLLAPYRTGQCLCHCTFGMARSSAVRMYVGILEFVALMFVQISNVRCTCRALIKCMNILITRNS